MKDEKINQLVKELYDAMFAYWKARRKNKDGFAKPHEQSLYNSLCNFRSKEKLD